MNDAPFWAGHSTTGIKDGLSIAFNNAVEAVKGIWNKFATWLNQKLTFNISNPITGDNSTIKLGNLQAFSTGGFPEDCLFMANHGELVGKFANGKTAVANNEQITQGISDAVYRGNQENNLLVREEITLLQNRMSLFWVFYKKKQEYPKTIYSTV